MSDLTVMVVVVCVAVFVVGLLSLVGVIAPVEWSGTETFGAEQEYTEFKQAVVDSGLELTKVETLSSNPPIIVSFVLTGDQSQQFPYGSRSDSGVVVGGVLIAVSLVGFGILALSR